MGLPKREWSEMATATTTTVKVGLVGDFDNYVIADRIMMKDDRGRLGLSLARASWLVGASAREYRALEDGESYPDFETWDRICKLYGWPQTFVGSTEMHSRIAVKCMKR
jgi:hypothetical protein